MCLREKKCDVQQKSQPFGQPKPAKIFPVPETFQPNTFSQLTMSGCLYGIGISGSPSSRRK